MLKALLKDLTSNQFPDNSFNQIKNDSREVLSNDLFLAYPGHNRDGRHFIADAIARGAQIIVYEAGERDDIVEQQYPDILFISIKNLSNHVGAIAARFYQHPSQHLSVIGITGTNGKTSCSHFIAQALTALGESCAVLGTLGNGLLTNLSATQLTTPDGLILHKLLAEFWQNKIKNVAMEVSSHALAQDRVAGVQFEMAVLTQLSRDHLDYHGNMENYAKAKALLFQKPGLKYAVLNLDDKLGQALAKQSALNILTYSTKGQKSPSFPYIITQHIKPMIKGFHIAVETSWGKGEFETEILGHFNISNLLAVLGVLLLKNISLTAALKSLNLLTGIQGRMQMVGGNSLPHIVVDYAHTPDALKKVLTSLREHCQGKLICIFGCGGDRDKGKRPEMAAIAEQYADKIILTNDNPRFEAPDKIIQDIIKGFKKSAAMIELDRRAAIHLAIHNATQNDIILIAGKGHEKNQVIANKIIPFDDVEVAKEALKLIGK